MGRAGSSSVVGFVLVAFAANSLITRFVVSQGLMDPGLATAVRFVSGAMALLVIHRLLRGRLPRAPTRAHAHAAVWLGVYAFAISYGYAFISAAAGTFVFYAMVLVTMTAHARFAGARRTTARELSGGALALAGVAVLAVGRVEGTTPLGVGLLALTGGAWGLYSSLGRRFPDALAYTTSNFALLSIALVPFGLLAGFATGGLAGVVTPTGLAWVLFMGMGTTALSYVAWYWALARLTSAQAATYQLAIPVITGVLGILVLGEAWSWRLGAAGALVLAGMALATPAREKAEQARLAQAPPLERERA